VEAAPDITMPELAAKLAAEKAVTAHPASLSRVLLKAGLSFKKTMLASEADLPTGVELSCILSYWLAHRKQRHTLSSPCPTPT